MGRPTVNYEQVSCSTASKAITINNTVSSDRYEYLITNTEYLNSLHWKSTTDYVRGNYAIFYNEVYRANFGNTNMGINNSQFAIYWVKVYNSANVKCVVT